LFKKVNGIARPNEVLAIMGSSGSGKTTRNKDFATFLLFCLFVLNFTILNKVLNVLNFRNQGLLSVNGEIKLNGRGVDSVEAISKVAGYVQQDVIHSISD
jgi:energy-coupling factor transporter ATP-binding protein EcfA2